MSSFSSFCSVITCGICGDQDDNYGQDNSGPQEPLLNNSVQSGPSAGGSALAAPSQIRAKKPVNTSNMLGLGIRDVNADYELGELLGEGAFGVVRRCVHRKTGQEFACKTVVKSQLKRRADVEDVRREVQILMVRTRLLNGLN